MPNWNNATLYLRGTKENIDALVETGFDFQKLVPMPDELNEDGNGKNLGGRCWKKTDKISTLEEWQINCKTDQEREQMKEHYEQYLKDFELVCSWIDKYGVNGWHEWALQYWGTKWNPYPDNVSMERESDTKLRVTLTTAWNLPVPILTHIMQKYDLRISGDTVNEHDGKLMEFALN